MKNRRFWIIAVAASVALAMLPAQAIEGPEVDPTFVPGDSDCASVGSTGTQVTVNDPAVGVDVPLTVTGGQILMHDVERREFDFTATGVVVLDVVVKGSGANHYDYGVSGIAADDGLKIPNGNKLNWVHFCYAAVPTFSISGNKFEDANADGLHQETEIGLSGWTIQLKQGETVLQSTTTDADGAYSFSGVEAGDYQVCEVLVIGWVQTSPEGCHLVTVGPDAVGIKFLNVEAVDICAEPASATDGGTSGTFVAEGGCQEGEVKLVDVSVEDDIVILRPLGTTVVAFTGTLTFVRELANPIPPLQYDQDLTGDDFVDVPVCVDGEPPAGDTWCVTGVTVSSSEGSMTVIWNVFGRDDPRFK
ncbi:MAG TPA: SdrD B-like domain-containing protein [Acidimicrobiia bacterium]|nr:SdrD B-like domain-containing protein [Acidimicrobiia bacterium]